MADAISVIIAASRDTNTVMVFWVEKESRSAITVTPAANCNGLKVKKIEDVQETRTNGVDGESTSPTAADSDDGTTARATKAHRIAMASLFTDNIIFGWRVITISPSQAISIHVRLVCVSLTYQIPNYKKHGKRHITSSKSHNNSRELELQPHRTTTATAIWGHQNEYELCPPL